MAESGPRVPLQQATDRALAGRAADGDVAAFELLVRRHGPRMRAYAIRMLGSTDESDDVVQEAFLTLWQKLPTLDNVDAIPSWLMRVVTRNCLDRIRSRHPHPGLDEDSLPPQSVASTETAAETHSEQEALSLTVMGLPDDQRRCWLLREVAGYSYDDIAQELDLPVSTVRGLLARARKTVIREMEAWR